MDPEALGGAQTPADDVLQRSTLQVIGVLREASNVTMLVDLVEPDGTATGHRAVYKPVRGERPLADFPTGTLAAREVAAYLISELGGWHLVPPTVLREGPLGAGSVQLWMDVDDPDDPGSGLIDVVRPADVAPGWRRVVEAQDETGRPLVVVHADDARLRSLALFDVVIDNADRKAAHLGLTGDRLWGFDHGLCLNVAPKLRTVLWGWAGEELSPQDRRSIEAVHQALRARTSGLETLLDEAELRALHARLDDLRATPVMPQPSPERYPLPWPLW